MQQNKILCVSVCVWMNGQGLKRRSVKMKIKVSAHAGALPDQNFQYRVVDRSA